MNKENSKSYSDDGYKSAADSGLLPPSISTQLCNENEIKTTTDEPREEYLETLPIELKVTGIEVFINRNSIEGGFRLSWTGLDSKRNSPMYGQYELIVDTRVNQDNDAHMQILGYSRCLDSNNDKRFIKSLLQALTDNIVIAD